jgi:phage terminase large subunit-like protein
MTLLEHSLTGSQTPRLCSLPAGVVSDAPGRAAVAQAHAAGLDLDPWQQAVLRQSLGVRADGKWAAFSVGLLVPRQNGKGTVLEALALAMLFQFHAELVVWTAHEMKTAKEGFRRLVSLVTSTPDLMRQVAHIRHGNDDRGIELKSGARVQFLARSSGSGRGFSGDCVILDEAYKLDGDTMAALLPTLSAVPNPQIWYTSSAPFASSEQLHAVRKRGVAGDDPRLAFFEWSMPDDADPRSRETWALANPGYPHRIDDEAIEAEWREFNADDDPAKFKRERLGVPDEPPGVSSVVPNWAELVDPDSSFVGSPRIALDVSPLRDRASFAAAGRRADGMFHVEPIECRPRTDWVVDAASKLWAKWRVPVRIQAGSPAASFVTLLEEAGVEVDEVTHADHGRAVGVLLDAAAASTLRHLGASSLDSAVRGAELRPSGDVDVWARRSPRVDITPLVAATLALGAVPAPDRKPRIHTLKEG